jgi:membrane protein DedA with SNARE-associated domain
MEETFVHLCEHLSNHMWLQSLLVMAGTCFIEDPARCGVGLLVAAGHINWWLAFFSMTAGGVAGDLGLYVIGRYATQFLLRRRWVEEARLVWMKTHYKRHAFKTVMISRFIPGARTLAYVSAGAIRYPIPRFTLMLWVAAMVQSLIFLQLSAFIAEEILPYLHDTRLRFSFFGLIVLLLVLGHHILSRRQKQRLSRISAADPKADA